MKPSDWETKSFEGEPLLEIRSALSVVMSDGGSLIGRLLDGSTTGKDTDLGEAALCKLYTDYVRPNRDFVQPFQNDSNTEVLQATASRCAELKITLPSEVLEANPTVRPDRLQGLYDFLSKQVDFDRFLPIHPGRRGANDRMKETVELLERQLGGVENQSHTFYTWLAQQWIYNIPLSEIISKRIGYQRSMGVTTKTSVLIREIMDALEKAIRFRMVKYYMAFVTILIHILEERGEADRAKNVEPFYVYLECGASDHVALSLIGLGLSRVTALALRKKVRFADEASPEDCYAVLKSTNLTRLHVPRLCIRELEDLLGMRSQPQ